jgi:hypothetical protein
MILENQVCTIEQAKKLKELGVIQKSLFYWHPKFERPVFGETSVKKHGKQYTVTQVCNDKEVAVSAFTASEIGDMLPDLIEYDNRQYELVIVKEEHELWLCQYSRNNNLLDTLLHIDRIYKKELVQSLAEMAILLMELGKILPPQINHKLFKK